MVIYTQEWNISNRKSIFLAGPTALGSNQITNWRQDAIRYLDDRFVILVPEPVDGEWPEYGKQIDWELRQLSVADVIMFWIPRSANLPGLRTNVEFGYWVESHKVVYGRPDDATHIRYLDIIWQKIHPYDPIFNDLGTMCQYINKTH